MLELANGSMALVVECKEGSVVLDANTMMAGKALTFELQLLAIGQEG